MKVYVFGSDKDACIELANQLNDKGASALIAKAGEGLSEVSGRIGKAFDAAIMVSEDPIKDAVVANRDPKVTAAVCYNQKSLKAAVNDGVNLFILESGTQDKIDISDIVGATTPAAQKQPQPKPEPSGFGARLFKGAPLPSPKQPAKKDNAEKQQPKKEKRNPTQEDSDEDSGSGIGSRIKDIFGIEE